MPDGVRMRISSVLAVVMVLSLLECRWYTSGTMDTLVADDLAAGDGQKLSVVAYGALLDMILRGAIAPGEPVTERLIAVRLGMSRTPTREAGRGGGWKAKARSSASAAGRWSCGPTRWRHSCTRSRCVAFWRAKRRAWRRAGSPLLSSPTPARALHACATRVWAMSRARTTATSMPPSRRRRATR